ncbi:MAG: HlyC/CorC family transporter [Saprospirales bacterium]|jgi:putative hemolysin|nr:HlyC/CorC family transporter [Saprospirales bacterium]MBK6903220.1 HlyC/CorC family transporter [Saprospirales bacterium]MBK7334770.1 HlyC/CorC family transporter [Saprospirales bacterium]
MEILIIFFLTLLNGLFSLSEIALVSVKRSRIEQKALKGDLRAKTVLDLLRQPENFLSSVQVGITLIGIIAGAYGGATLVDNFEPWVAQFESLNYYSHEIALVIVIGTITYFTIVIGELIPKTIALNYAEPIALFFGSFVKFITLITYPLVKLLSVSTRIVLRLLGIKGRDQDALTEEELRQLIKAAGTQGVIKSDESRIHQNIFLFADQKAKNLMTHRTDVEWIDVEDPPDLIATQIRESGFSKFPACRETIEEIQGILNAKDFFEKRNEPGFTMASILQKPLYIPEIMSAIDILRLFKTHKQYLGIVVDEFGSFEGIVTLHDLTSAILGDLPILGEEEEPEFIVRDDSSLLVNGSLLIPNLNDYLGEELVNEDPEHYATLAGFVIFRLNRIPMAGDHFEHKGHKFEIVDMDGRRVDKIILTKLELPT